MMNPVPVLCVSITRYPASVGAVILEIPTTASLTATYFALFVGCAREWKTSAK